MRYPLLRPLSSILILGIVVFTPSCGGSLAPFEPEIANATDNLQFQATNVRSTSLTRTYTWQNSGTRATVNHSTTTTAGTAQLTIRDASGATVYDKALIPSLNEPTTAGTSGTWTVQLRLTNYSGTVNFRVQKL